LQACGDGHPIERDVGVQAAHGLRDDPAGFDQRQIIVDAKKPKHLSDKQGELVLGVEVAERGWLALVRLCHLGVIIPSLETADRSSLPSKPGEQNRGRRTNAIGRSGRYAGRLGAMCVPHALICRTGSTCYAVLCGFAEL
jgi:hypothetical protein